MTWIKKQSTITAIIMSVLFVTVSLAAEDQSQALSGNEGVQSESSQQEQSQDQSLTNAKDQGTQSESSQYEQSEEKCTGKILKHKLVTIKGKNQTNQVVLMESKDGSNVAVDLGPSQNLSSIQLKAGQEIDVKGKIVRIGDRKVLFANYLTIDGQKIKIRRMIEKAQLMRHRRAMKRDAGSFSAAHRSMREMQNISGTISKTRDVSVKNTGRQNTIALIEKSDGQMIVADLGPSEKLSNLQLKDNAAVSLKGRWVRVGDQPVLLTCELTMGSQKTAIEHPIGEILNQATKSLSGQIIRTKDVNVKGTQINNKVVMLQTKNDQQVLVDLGPTKNLSDVKIEEGKELEVQGWPIRIGDHLVMITQKFTCDGKTVETPRLETLKAIQQKRDAGTEQSPWGHWAEPTQDSTSAEQQAEQDTSSEAQQKSQNESESESGSAE